MAEQGNDMPGFTRGRKQKKKKSGRTAFPRESWEKVCSGNITERRQMLWVNVTVQLSAMKWDPTPDQYS